ncbi:MAG: glycosyltransferase [Deltaproteobacteria bacterium]|nr:glycosyltransferase [Deltaproteobacteria bacterium]
MHLLFTSLPYILNGYGVRSHSILRSQQRLGLSVLAVSRPGFPWDLKQFQHLGLEEVPHTERVEEVEYRRIADPGGGWGKVPLDVYLDRYAEHLRRVVEEVRPAVLHAASNFVNGCVAGAVGRARGIPVVYEARGFWEMTRGSVEPTFKTSLLFRCHQRLETQALEMADAVVCISEGLKREVMRRGIAAEKIQVIPNGVECQRFTPRAKDPALVAALGLEGKVVVGYIGSLVEYEGVDVLLQACAHLLRRHVPLKVLIVGEGVVRGKLEGLAREFSLGEAVCFTGRVPQAEVLRYYSVMDICPFPRKGLEICHMVTPLKPYEAMAMEKAVIVSDVEALREMVIEGETGLVCRADDAESLANAIGLLVEDRGLGERLGKEGRAWVSDHRDWGTLARRYLPVYETLGVKRANGRNTRGLGIENSDFVLF